MFKDKWVTKFVSEIGVNLRPDVGHKFATTIAIHQWIYHQNKNPVEIARLRADSAEEHGKS